MEVDILGTKYTVEFVNYEDDEAFAKDGIIGYCNGWSKHIVCCAMATHPDWKDSPSEALGAVERETVRHEIVHAFLDESGLQSSAFAVAGPWSKNEEMVDWIAIQGPKICAVWHEVGCI